MFKAFFVAYGVVLAAIALLLGGGAHGIRGFLFSVSAPFWFLGHIGGIIAVIVTWPAVAYAIEKAKPRTNRIVLFLFLHYGTGICGAFLGWDLGDAALFAQIRPSITALLIFGCAWYVAGQGWLWHRLLERNAESVKSATLSQV